MDNDLWKDGENSLVGRGSGTEYTFHFWALRCAQESDCRGDVGGLAQCQHLRPTPRAAGTTPRGQLVCRVHMHLDKAVVECQPHR